MAIFIYAPQTIDFKEDFYTFFCAPQYEVFARCNMKLNPLLQTPLLEEAGWRWPSSGPTRAARGTSTCLGIARRILP
jgi:hypothetical protein